MSTIRGPRKPPNKRIVYLREKRGLTFEAIAKLLGYSTRERARQNYWKAKREELV